VAVAVAYAAPVGIDMIEAFHLHLRQVRVFDEIIFSSVFLQHADHFNMQCAILTCQIYQSKITPYFNICNEL